MKNRFIDLAVVAGILAFLAASAIVWLGASPVTAQNQDYVFLGGGWGHGAGMSQYGAYGRAVNGHTHEEILDFYYEGSRLTDLPQEDVLQDLRVLITYGKAISLTPEGINRLAIDGNTLTRPAPGTRIRVSLAGNGNWNITTSAGSLCPANGCAGEALRLHFATGSSVFVSSVGRSYLHGRFTLTRIKDSEGEFRVVLDRLKMEDYMLGIAEMPGDWHIEAQKAQAVAARSYAYSRILARRGDPNWNPNFDLYSGTSDQVYSGNSQELSPAAEIWREAVRETENQVLVDKNSRPITAFYSSSNGGYSARSSVVFEMDLPYIAAKPDSFDSYENPNANWRRAYSIQELSQWLNLREDIDIGALSQIIFDEEISESGRIDLATVTLKGTRGTEQLTGRDFLRAINSGISKTNQGFSRRLLSTRVSLGPDSEQVPEQNVLITGANIFRENQTLPTKPVGALEKFIYDKSQNLHLSGWAFDGEISDEASLEIRLYEEDKLVAITAPGELRVDILTQRGYGLNGGFTIQLPSQPQGPTTYCVIAEDTLEEERTVLGCQTYSFGGGKPFGELLKFEAESDGSFRVQGWAIDPSEAIAPAQIHVFINGSLHTLEVADSTLAELDNNRIGKDRGFDLRISPTDVKSLRGENTVCVRIASSSISTASSRSLGCVKWEVNR